MKTLKWWIKRNNTHLYKKYMFDPHAFIIRRAKISRSLRAILNFITYKNLKKIYQYRLQILKSKKTLKFAYNKKNINSNQFKSSIKKKIILNSLKNWRVSFWSKFKNNYFNKNFIKKKNVAFFFADVYFKSVFNKTSKLRMLRKATQKFFSSTMTIKKRKQRKANLKSSIKILKKKLAKRLTWLNIIKHRKKPKTWWLLRIQQRKSAYYYGITHLKKFRYINHLSTKPMPLKLYSAPKLEFMINMFLFRINLFDNIFIVNRFIRLHGIQINYKNVLYPYRSVKQKDIISFSPLLFKKFFNIFVKRSRYNKSFIIKKIKSSISYYRPSMLKVLKMVKNIVNVPSYIEYNYKILHFVMWRVPHQKELSASGFKYFNSHDWSIDTQLQYN